jgi:hypothetical protein
MKSEPSKLAQLVISYYQKFGRHVPESALRLLGAGDLAAYLQDSLATNVPLAETGCGTPSSFEFSPHEFRRGGCIVSDKSPESPTPTKGPNGEWLQ